MESECSDPGELVKIHLIALTCFIIHSQATDPALNISVVNFPFSFVGLSYLANS